MMWELTLARLSGCRMGLAKKCDACEVFEHTICPASMAGMRLGYKFSRLTSPAPNLRSTRRSPFGCFTILEPLVYAHSPSDPFVLFLFKAEKVCFIGAAALSSHGRLH